MDEKEAGGYHNAPPPPQFMTDPQGHADILDIFTRNK